MALDKYFLQKSKYFDQQIILLQQCSRQLYFKIKIKNMIFEGFSFLEEAISNRLATKISKDITKLYQRELRNDKISQVMLFENQNIPRYKQSHNLQVGEQMIDRIREQLNLQIQAKRSTIDRIKHKDTYLQHTFNPFALESVILQSQPAPLTQRKQANIIDGVQKMKKGINVTGFQQRIHKIQLSFYGRHTKAIKKSISSTHRHNFSYHFDQEKLPQRHLRSDMDFQFLNRMHNRKDENLISLDFSKKKLNLFRLIHQKSPTEFVNCREALKRFHFCHDSIADNPENKQGFITFRQISAVSRQLMEEKHNLIADEHRLQSSQIRLNLEKLSFDDIMLASTGMLECDELTKYLLGNTDVNDSTEVINLFYSNANKPLNPVYESSQRNKLTLFEHESNSTHLEEKLKKFPPNQKQLGQMSLSKQLTQKMRQVLNRQRLIISYGIKDQQIRRGINDTKIQIMNRQILNSRIATEIKENTIDIDRKIRMSKNYKDRTENIKNNFLQMTLRVVKKQQRITKPAINRTGKKKPFMSDFDYKPHKTENSFESSIDTHMRKSVQTDIRGLSISPKRTIKSNQRQHKFTSNNSNRYMKF